jgi:hypothetical protein
MTRQQMMWAATKRARATRAMALATRVLCDNEGDGSSNKGNGDEGGRQVAMTKVMATMWAMAMAMRLVGNKEGKGKGGKGHGNGNVRVAGKEEGKGSKTMALETIYGILVLR